MKKGAILSIILLTLLQPVMAQITGNVKLVNMYGDTLTDNSGIVIYLEPVSPTSTYDTTITDIDGNYSLTPNVGNYDLIARMSGYIDWSIDSISENDTIDDLIMYEELPQVIIPAGNVSGTWPGYQLYVITGSVTIPAGDTLTIEPGAFVSLGEVGQDQLAPNGFRELIVDGHLNILGNDTSFTIVASIDSTNGGYLFGNHWFQMNPGSSMYIDNAYLPNSNYSYIVGADIKISNIKPKTLAYQPFVAARFDNSYTWFHHVLRSSSLQVSDCQMDLMAQGLDKSNIQIFCTKFFNYLSHVSASDSSSLLIEHSGKLPTVGCSDCSSFTLRENLLGGDISVSNSSLGFTSNVYINNNVSHPYSPSPRVNISGDINFHYQNNAIGNDNHLFIDSTVSVIELDNNILVGSRVVIPPPYYVKGGGVPSWILEDWTPTGTQVDTIDSHGNTYIRDFGNPTPAPWITSDTSTFTSPRGYILYFGYDSFLVDKGDPNLLDPDGTRSDRGPRNIYGCVDLIPLMTAIPDSVYPGDTNHDGIADNNDLLPIGLKYLFTGPVRSIATTNWVGQDAPDWNDSLASNLNIKHVDCDGDGIIDSTDINAIYLNFGLTHNNPKRNFTDGLWYQFPNDSIFEGDTIEIGVMLGRSQAPINNFYGMAFTMLYDSAFIKPGSAKMAFDPCWVGTDSVDMISFFREDTTILKYDAALVRTDGVNVSGFGPLGTLTVVMNDDIQAKDGFVALSYMDFQDIFAINFQEQELQIGGELSTFHTYIGYDRTTGLKSIEKAEFMLYPNPAKDVLIIKSYSSEEVAYEIFNLNGTLLLSGNTKNATSSVDISELNNGLYLVKVGSGPDPIIKKLSIVK